MGLHDVKANLKIMLIISKERRAGGRDRGRKEGGTAGEGRKTKCLKWERVSSETLPPPPPPVTTRVATGSETP